VLGDSGPAVDRQSAEHSRPFEPEAEPIHAEALASEEPQRHETRVLAALEKIRSGDLYQVNLSRRLRFNLKGRGVDWLAALGSRTRAPFSAHLSFDDHEVISSSPELFLALDGARRLQTRPIKGTRPRGAEPGADAELGRQLELDEKERAELAMVLDVERNDLGRISVPGSVRLVSGPSVESCGPVWHRSALLESRLRAEVDREAVLLAMLPSGSVTGAPKIRAMEVIAELEAERRGLYTGALGFVNHAGGFTLAMAIRTLVRRGLRGALAAGGAGACEYDVGGGIVIGSDPGREVEETSWKAAQLLDLVAR
jgi:anthranilate/para-aminobenzoate synthase component I